MGHYTGPKARINRRLGAMIFENNGARKAAERRDTPPGMHTRPSKLSGYGQALREKQKIKYFYGLGERQLRRLFHEASRRHGNTGEHLLTLCEMRLDNIVRRAGLTLTRPQARQGISHGHFRVNGRKADIPSMLLRPGDVVHVKGTAGIQRLYRMVLDADESGTAAFLSFDRETMEIRVERIPGPDEFSLPANVNIVVELLTR